MKQLAALKKLAEKVEAGTEPTADDTWPIASCSSPVEGMAWAMCAVKSFGGSLDAAKALETAVVPNWDVTHAWGNDVDGWSLTLTNKAAREYVTGKSIVEARARLLATIHAKILELEGSQ